MTVELHRLILRSWIEAIAARSHRVFAGGLHVTSRSRRRTIRAFFPPIPATSAPRPARDIRRCPRHAVPGMLAVAHARRRGHPARAALVVVEPAAACEHAGTLRCTSAGGLPPTAQAETRLCTRCNIGAASRHAYRTTTPDRGGSILANRPGSFLASVEGRVRRQQPPATRERACDGRGPQERTASRRAGVASRLGDLRSVR